MTGISVTAETSTSLLNIPCNASFPEAYFLISTSNPYSLKYPFSCAINIKELIEGARKAQECCSKMDLDTNIAYQYAAARFILHEKGKDIEVLSTFYQRLTLVDEWWKQLFGESEGKEGKGIFPTSLNFTMDLHSMGQLIQEGQRNMFETFLIVENYGKEMIIPEDPDDLDNFNCVAGRDLDYVNKRAYRATAMAHYEGGVPNMAITVPRCA